MTSLQKAIREDLSMRMASYPTLSERVEHYSEKIPDAQELAGYVREVAVIELALAAIAHDRYYPVVEMYYFEGKTDKEIGAKIHCDPSTAARNRHRLVRRLAAILYDIPPAAQLQVKGE